MLQRFLSNPPGDTLEILQHLEVIGFVLVGAYFMVRPGREDRRPYLFCFLNLALITGAVVTLYDVNGWRDYRTIAPHLLLSVLVLLSGGAYRWALVLSILQMAFVVPFLTQFEQFHQTRPAVTSSGAADASSLFAGHVTYDASGSPWDNTVLMPARDATPGVLAVPTGIGISFAMEGDGLRLPPRSRYVFVSSPRSALLAGLRLRRLASNSFGALYLNLDAAGAAERPEALPSDQ
jgi:hypothetical protein